MAKKHNCNTLHNNTEMHGRKTAIRQRRRIQFLCVICHRQTAQSPAGIPARLLNGILNGVSRRQTPLNWRSRRWRSADRRRRGVTVTSVEALARRLQHRRARHAARGSCELTWACCTYECKLSAWTLLLSWEFLLVLSFSCRDSCLRVACSNVCRHYYYNVYNITVR